MLDAFYAFRESVVDALVADLIGPSSPREEISDAPLDRYISGVLYPISEDPVDPAEDLGADERDDDEVGFASDPPVAMANVRYPSSMGLTFSVDTNGTDELEVEIGGAWYEPVEPEEDDSSAVPRDTASEEGDEHAREEPARRRRRGAGPSELRWRRLELDAAPVPVDVGKFGSRRERLVDDLQLFVRVREPDGNGVSAVTVVLLNTKRKSGDGLRDKSSLFQAKLVVRARGEKPVFVERRGDVAASADVDLRSNDVLYRHARAFAVGHGCSVTWTVGENLARATHVETTFAPTFDLRVAESNPGISSPVLSMLFLASAAKDDVIGGLREFVGEYEAWIKATEVLIGELPPSARTTGEDHIAGCIEAARRMLSGIATLERDETSWRAFKLANRAMLGVRARTEWLRAGKPVPEPVEGSEHAWRPFQLGFLLLCLTSIVDRTSPERGIADLLWFPTGGGKTEAYLGLIAFTTFLRRLRGEGQGGGTTALMRYTLRLLTIQQFERASLLICSCESLRQQADDLGAEEIAIGLWVGEDGTPNDLRTARKSIDQLRNGQRLEKANPVQLHRCPWCGESLDASNYWIDKNPARLVVGCRTGDCAFAQRLPVYVVDEDIYDFRPTLLIATADKFASLPWRERFVDLFNRGDDVTLPPELIIQDELHLISGPLGTLAGLYETAIDLLATHEGVVPKIVASTATIRRAGTQVGSLFARDLRQFPPPGLDARDSFFAVEADPARVGSRLYVGLMTPATSQSTLMIRAYAALLHGAATLAAPSEDVRDPYWTLVGYFNSLRVLGGARMQVQDDVNDRLELLARAVGSEARSIDQRIELTSREPSGDIPGHLEHLTFAHPDERALDVVLATNMISVGVDIGRLGLMVVMGQPQSTSEYIQATSRVGREYPGLVVTLFNAARSRDRSHYESFVAYHSALYRQVESTSVTPFSARARDRGLHAVLVGLVRLLIPDLRANDGASRIRQHVDDLRVVRDAILERVVRVAPDELEATRQQLDTLIEDWMWRAGEIADLKYLDRREPEKALLVDAARAGEAGSEDALPTLWSLRDVDQSSNLYLVAVSKG